MFQLHEKEYHGGHGKRKGEFIQIATIGEYPRIFCIIFTGTSQSVARGRKASTVVGALENMMRMTELWLVLKKYKGHSALEEEPMVPPTPNNTIVLINSTADHSHRSIMQLISVSAVSDVTDHSFTDTIARNALVTRRDSVFDTTNPTTRAQPIPHPTTKPVVPQPEPIKQHAALNAKAPTFRFEAKAPLNTKVKGKQPANNTIVDDQMWGSGSCYNRSYISELPKNNVRPFDSYTKVYENCYNPNFKSERPKNVPSPAQYVQHVNFPYGGGVNGHGVGNAHVELPVQHRGRRGPGIIDAVTARRVVASVSDNNAGSVYRPELFRAPPQCGHRWNGY